jgi:hypothetical protein
MAKGKQSSTRGKEQITTPRTRRVKALPTKPGTTIYYADPNLAVVSRPAKGGAGGIDRPTIDICKCTKTEYKCTTGANNNTICKEVCVEWECTTLPAARQ